MKTAIELRNRFFQEVGKHRIKRILVCSFAIAMVWLLADYVSGNLGVNLWHDIACLLLGIVLERILPWGKQSDGLR